MSGPYVHRLRVRYNECDGQGIVFNAHYLTYFDIAVTELWRDHLGGYAEAVARGVDWVVAEANLRYRSPARFDDDVEIRVSFARIGTTSVQTHADVARDGDVLVEIDVRYVFVEPGTLTKLTIPDDVRVELGRFAA